MINHPERITLAHIADMVSGKQRHISDYVDLDIGEVRMGAKRVRRALEILNQKRMGGEKI